MKHYEVSAFRYIAKFNDEDRARECFDMVKDKFTYCELKEVKETAIGYQSKSIEIFIKH